MVVKNRLIFVIKESMQQQKHEGRLKKIVLPFYFSRPKISAQYSIILAKYEGRDLHTITCQYNERIMQV